MSSVWRQEQMLSLENVSFAYAHKRNTRESIKVLEEVSFDLRLGETVGVIGRNGAGKSTLLRLLAGVLQPSAGTIRVRNNLRCSLLSLGVGFLNDLSGTDNVTISLMLQGFIEPEIRVALPQIREFSDLGEAFEDRVSTYSSGMRSRLTFSTALFAMADVLLIDEVLAVGDGHFKKKASKALKEKISGQQTVVLVSHSEGSIANLCDRVIWIENGRIVLLGDTTDVLDQYHLSYQD